MGRNVVAETIMQQIGGKAFAMMGTKKDIWHDKNSLIFKVRGSRVCQKVKVELKGDDTYTVSFYHIDVRTYKVTSKEVAGIYYDNLNHIIEAETGIYLSL
jgi:hypothetical protein